MKASEARLLEFLKRSPQFVIPIYQRTYSWREPECRRLWEDILRSGRDVAVPAHFVGSIVYVEKGLYHVSSQSPLLVIDGQQRLTTVMLLIEALARALGNDEPLDGFSTVKLRNYYLLNSLEPGDRRFKLILSQTDRASLIAVLDQQPQPADHSIRVEENFRFFLDRVTEAKHELKAVCEGLAKLMIVDISLSREQDNPQLIFESLNSTGRELSQADLIRNYVLMSLEPELQAKLYDRYWRPMEMDFGQEAYATHFDSFMRHYLTIKMGAIPNTRAVYDAFKQYAQSAKLPIEGLLADIRDFARYYHAIALGAERDPELQAAFHDIRELRVEVAYPFLLELYHDYDAQRLSRGELLQAVRLVESYVFRRAVCDMPSNSLNKTFATLGREVDKTRYIESIQARLLLLSSYRRFPDDGDFMRKIQVKDLYNFRSRSYWLRRMENQGRKERVLVGDYTVEHIMPQNEHLSAPWQTDLGPDWKRIHKTYLHVLGNLTLTGYNSEYADRSFQEKRDIKGGFAESPLRLNHGLGGLQRWTEDSIRRRGEELARQAAAIWPAPTVAPAILATYKTPGAVGQYSIQDHPYLLSGPNQAVFEQFRREVLALDPVVTEQFLKLYVAYKAETNFVDVVPQAGRLRLSLNMPFPEIDDPKGRCRDVSDRGRWGNGDVEVSLASIGEIPYVVGLVRQALERQIADNQESG